jgi:hypothetical protein
VRLAIGPVRSVAVRAWVENALFGMSLAEAGGDGFPFKAPPESLAPAFAYLEQWLSLAGSGDVVEWSGDVDDLLALQLVRYWHNIARAMLDLTARGDVDRLDEVAEEFSEPLLRSLLDGLVDATMLTHDVAERMWNEWPRLKLLDRPADSGGT